jgi:hypothetical protein
MRVILSQDNAVPVVAVYMIYNVGARSEEKGRTGFAHLFEHMMFEGSANAPKGMQDKVIEANGGQMNGSTHPYYTDYFETLPSNKLQRALPRIRPHAQLAITAENLQNQKEAVKQERRLPTTALLHRYRGALAAARVSKLAGSHSLIGSFETNAASVDACAASSRPITRRTMPCSPSWAISASPKRRSSSRAIWGHPSQRNPAAGPFRAAGSSCKRHLRPLADRRHYRLSRAGAGPDYNALYMLDAILTGGDSSRFQPTWSKEAIRSAVRN